MTAETCCGTISGMKMDTKTQHMEIDERPRIDVAKLRRLLSERRQMLDAARRTTDQYLASRDEVARLELRHADELRRSGYGTAGRDGIGGKLLRKRAEARIEAARDEARQIAEQRDAASERAQNPALPGLVDYARKNGFVVDESRATIRLRIDGEPIQLRGDY